MNQWTLQSLMAAVTCKTYPERWNALLPAVCETYKKQGCSLTNPAFYRELEKKYHCFGELLPIFCDAAAQAAEEEALSLFLLLVSTAIQNPATKMEDILAIPEVLPEHDTHPLAYRMTMGLIICSQLEGMAERLRSRGIPHDMICTVMRATVGMERGFEERHHGLPGYDHLGWGQNYIDGILFPIGRLEAEICRFPKNAVVFQNGSGEVVTLADGLVLHKSGFALGAAHYEDAADSWTANLSETETDWTGYPFIEKGFVSHTPVTLSKKDWTKVLWEGEPVIGLHIPAKGKLLPEQVDETLVQMQAFVSRYFPEHRPRAFFCHSWLMDPQLTELLPETSNIARFTGRFHAMTYPSQGAAVFYFVFFDPSLKENLSCLPERTTLERVLKVHYQSGKAIYELPAFRLFSEQ